MIKGAQLQGASADSDDEDGDEDAAAGKKGGSKASRKKKRAAAAKAARSKGAKKAKTSSSGKGDNDDGGEDEDEDSSDESFELGSDDGDDAAEELDLETLLAGRLGDDDPEFVEEGPAAMDVGCTAVVAMVHDGKVYCANAGDSRCIVSRGGKAVALSHDHSPDVDTEIKRIEAAGGTITEGRVEGNLNLCRAIGDQNFKRNAELPAAEQIITAQPDVMVTAIGPEDEFMILVCDGITNVMENQAIVDFVRERIGKAAKLSAIAEEMMDSCLSTDLQGDCNGTDNMSVLIVEFKSDKRGKATKEPVYL
jgi:protein phosphatase 1G